MLSRVPGPLGRNPTLASPRTPGPLGHNDAASPETPSSFLGDTPGPLGRNDCADPDIARLALHVSYLWASSVLVASVHVQTQGRTFASSQQVTAIQALIDQAIVVERETAEMEREAKALRQARDPLAADKERAAHMKRLEVRGLRQQAINLAVTAYRINIYHVKSLLYSDSDTDSETDDEGNVRIGRGAFTSPGELGSTIAHEAEVHVNQQNIKGRSYGGQQGRALNEVQAYDWEIANEWRFGLTKDQVAGLRRNRAHYLPFLTEAEQQRRKRGDYTIERGHEDD